MQVLMKPGWTAMVQVFTGTSTARYGREYGILGCIEEINYFYFFDENAKYDLCVGLVAGGFMEIQQLKGFHAVAKFKNFTVAAKKTHRTQPTISLQVKALEDELGVKLFERLGKRRVDLTPEGQLLYDISLTLVQEFDALETRFNESRGNFQHSAVRIVTHRSVMVYLFPKIIEKFKRKFPECRLVILNRNRDEILQMIENNEADFGVTSLSIVPSSLEYKRLAKYDRILIATKDHPLSKRSTIDLKELSEHPLILPTRESNTRKLIDQLFENAGLTYDLTMEVVGRDAIKTYVGMDLGISIINEYYVSPDDRKKLFVKNLSRQFGQAETGLVTRRGKILSAPAREFLKLLGEHQDLT